MTQAPSETNLPPPVVGAPAPAFALPLTGGRTFDLGALKGRNVVVYFYPKDDTSGCTKEAQEFDALRAEFRTAGAEIVGISPDSVASKAKFAGKYGLELDLAADEDRRVLGLYGVWVEKSMYGRRYMGVERTTYLIDREGIVRQIWTKVKVPGHAGEVLAAARAL